MQKNKSAQSYIPYTTPFFLPALPPEDPSPVLLRPNTHRERERERERESDREREREREPANLCDLQRLVNVSRYSHQVDVVTSFRAISLKLHTDFKGVVRATSCPTEHVAATTALALHLRASAQQDPPIHLLPPGFGFSVWGLVFEPTHLQPPAKHTSNVDVIDRNQRLPGNTRNFEYAAI